MQIKTRPPIIGPTFLTNVPIFLPNNAPKTEHAIVTRNLTKTLKKIQGSKVPSRSAYKEIPTAKASIEVAIA